MRKWAKLDEVQKRTLPGMMALLQADGPEAEQPEVRPSGTLQCCVLYKMGYSGCGNTVDFAGRDGTAAG